MNSDMMAIFDVLEKYHDQPYMSPLKATNEAEKKRIENLKSECSSAVRAFNAGINTLAKDRGLVAFNHADFLDGTKRFIRNYYWTQIKYVTFMDSAESISVFAELSSEMTARVRVVLEIKDNEASDTELSNHLRLFQKPLSVGLHYYENNKWADNIVDAGTDAVKVLNDVKKGAYRRAMLGGTINSPKEMKASALLDTIGKMIDNVLPYYDFVLGLTEQ